MNIFELRSELAERLRPQTWLVTLCDLLGVVC